MLAKCPDCWEKLRKRSHVASTPEKIDGAYRWVNRCTGCRRVLDVGDALDPQPKERKRRRWFGKNDDPDAEADDED